MKTENKIILLSIVAGLLFGLVDAILDSVFFYEKPFLDEAFFEVSPFEIYLRSLILIFFVIYGVLVSRIFVERKKADEALRESETKYRTLVENLPQKIFLKDEKSTYLSCNETFAKDLGIAQGEIAGKTDFDFFSKELANKYRADDRRIMKSGEVEELDESYIEGGEERIVHTVKTPIKDKKGKSIGILGIFWDITERKKMEEEKEKLMHDLDERAKELGLLYGISKVVEGEPLLDRMLQKIAGLIPPAWHYPEITCTRIVLEGKEFKTKNFKKTKWKQAVDIKVYEKKAGVVEVYYLKKMPEVDEGPFLKDEGALLDAVAERLGRIVERMRTEDLLKESEEKFRDLFENANDLIQSMDANGSFIYANKKWLDTLGYSKSELKKLKLTDILRGDQVPHCMEIFKRVCGGESLEGIETVFVAKDGREIIVEGSANAHFRDGKFVATRGIFRDITERKQHEKEYKQLIDGMNETTFVIDFKGKFVGMNDVAIKTLGYSRTELLTMGPVDIDPCLSPNEIGKLIEGMKLDGRQVFESQHRTKDGKIFPVEISSSLVSYRGKDAILSVARDITERKQAEEALQESENKWHSLFEDSKDAVYITSREGKFVEVNQSALDLFGYTREEMIGLDIMKIYVDPDARKGFQDEIEQKGSVRNYEVRFKKKDGTKMDCLITSTVRQSDDGKILGYHGIIRDITERKQMEEDLKESNRLKDLFTDIMRHDLINPAGNVKSLLQVAMEEKDEEDRNETLGYIHKNAERLILTIENAATIAKLEGERKLETSPLELGQILRDIVGGLKREAKGKGVEIENRVKGAFPIEANPLIGDVFSNLVSNAIKYGPEKGKVSVDIEDAGKAWKISVTNSGEGIKDKYKETVFERFKRKAKGGIKGSGLGLAIVKKVVELHKGKVWVEDNPKGGSIFYVELPKERKL